MTVLEPQEAEEASAPVGGPAAGQEVVPVEKLITRLASRDAAARLDAEAQLGQAGPEALQAAIAALERENRKKPLRFVLGTAVGAVIVSVLATLVASLISDQITIQGGAFVYAGLGIGAGFAPTRLQRALARFLSGQNDVRAVGPLSEALDRQDDGTKKLAAAALARLLPRLSRADAQALPPHQRKMLWHALLKRRDPALARGILHVAMETADERAVPFVEGVASGKGRGRADEALRADASAMLAALKERVEEERAHATLLRPASAPDEDMLLRPASVEAGSTDPALLLRAAEPAAGDGPGPAA